MEWRENSMAVMFVKKVSSNILLFASMEKANYVAK
jgi:hypothetical protein